MSKAKTQMIKLRDIVVAPNRMRQLRPEKVDEVAESIAARGQLQPIIVRASGAARLCAGAPHPRAKQTESCIIRAKLKSR